MRFLALICLLVCSLGLQAQEKAPAVKLAPQEPDVPAEKYGQDGKVNANFLKAHDNFVAIAKEGKAQLVFLGIPSRQAGLARKRHGRTRSANMSPQTSVSVAIARSTFCGALPTVNWKESNPKPSC